MKTWHGWRNYTTALRVYSLLISQTRCEKSYHLVFSLPSCLPFLKVASCTKVLPYWSYEGVLMLSIQALLHWKVPFWYQVSAANIMKQLTSPELVNNEKKNNTDYYTPFTAHSELDTHLIYNKAWQVRCLWQYLAILWNGLDFTHP